MLPRNCPSMSRITVFLYPAQTMTPQPPSQPSLPAGSGKKNNLFLVESYNFEATKTVGENISFCPEIVKIVQLKLHPLEVQAASLKPVIIEFLMIILPQNVAPVHWVLKAGVGTTPGGKDSAFIDVCKSMPALDGHRIASLLLKAMTLTFSHMKILFNPTMLALDIRVIPLSEAIMFFIVI